MKEENYWYSSLEHPLEDQAVAEAKIIVDAFRDREIPIEIGGFPDYAEEDDDPRNQRRAAAAEDRQPRALH